MWSLISSFATFSTESSTSPTHTTLKQASALSSPSTSAVSRSSSRSALVTAFSDEQSDVSECDMLSDYEFETFESGRSDWVEIRKSDVSNRGAAAAVTKTALYSAIAAKQTITHRSSTPSAKQVVSTPGVMPKSARKRQKAARRSRYRSNMCDLEVSQAQRLGHANL